MSEQKTTTQAAIPMTQKLATFIANTDGTMIPADIFSHAKVAFMDWAAVTLGGKDDPLVDKLIAYADLMGGNSQATILGRNRQMTMSQAALINGAASHALDYDDTLVSFLGHPSVTLFPSLLALSEDMDKSGRDFLTSYLIGLQAGGTIGACAGLDHYMAGWHATSTLGHLASAAGCARLLGLNEYQTVHALGIAGTQASGLKRVFGTMCKPFHAGAASEAGLMSALLAKDGFTSAEDILEGPQGFFQALKGGVNENILAFLGLGWDVQNLSQKYHASCHATHSPLEAAMAAVQENKIDLRNIRGITVYSSRLALGAAGKNDPQTGLEGKFSIPYCVANALLRGVTGNLAFTDELVNDPELQKLMGIVRVVPDEKKTALEADVEVTTTDGQTYRASSDILQQIPPLEIKQERIRGKFMDLCEPVIGRAKARRALESIDKLEETANMKDIAALF